MPMPIQMLEARVWIVGLASLHPSFGGSSLLSAVLYCLGATLLYLSDPCLRQCGDGFDITGVHQPGVGENVQTGEVVVVC